MSALPVSSVANDATLAAFAAGCRRLTTPCGTGTMVWRTWGTGRPVLLLHGGHGSWTHWLRNLGPLLAAGYAPWVPDLPGMGESDQPDLPWSPESLADTLAAGLDQLLPDTPVAVAGFSFGGMLGGHLAARHPERVKVLVLAGAAAMGMTSDDHLRLRDWRKVGADDVAGRRALHRHNLLGFMFNDPTLADDFTVRLHQVNVEADRLRNRGVSRGDTLYRALPNVRCPIHGVWGEQDELYRFGRERLEAAVRDLHFASFQWLPDCGHWVPYHQADRFNARLASILEREYPVS